MKQVFFRVGLTHGASSSSLLQERRLLLVFRFDGNQRVATPLDMREGVCPAAIRSA